MGGIERDKLLELHYQKGRVDVCAELAEEIVQAAVLYNDGKVVPATAYIAKKCQEKMHDAAAIAEVLDVDDDAE